MDEVFTRLAVPSDIPRLVEMAAAFVDYAGFEAMGFPFAPVKTATLMAELMASPKALLLVGGSDGEVRGMIGALAYPMFFSEGLMAQELFWWAEPATPGLGDRLLEMAERWAALKGCGSLSMVALSERRGRAVGRRLKSRGYVRMEERFIKRLT